MHDVSLTRMTLMGLFMYTQTASRRPLSETYEFAMEIPQARVIS